MTLPADSQDPDDDVTRQGDANVQSAEDAPEVTTDAGRDADGSDPTREETSDEEHGEAPESDLTREIVHRLAVGLAAVTSQTDAVRQRVRSGLGSTRDAAHRVAEATKGATDRAESGVAAAKARAVGVALRVEETTEQTSDLVQETFTDLGARARAAKAAGVDFYARHREEILALVITAVKVAAVIGVRRLARRVKAEDEARDAAEDAEGAHQGAKAARRVREASGIVVAVVGELGQVLSRQPSALPMLRELYRRGEPAEQAVVGMLLGPALSADPEHAVEVIREFLEDASDDNTADLIARRSLAPLLQENPDLVDRVTPWLRAAGPLVRRGALVGLGRLVSDKGSRVGDIVAAGVVVLEDHDEEVRQGLRWLLANASRRDLDATAEAVVAWRRGHEPRGAPGLEDMPEALRDRVEAIEREAADEEE